jgi:uncharacterized protein YndB with AHSA1/START domain
MKKDALRVTTAIPVAPTTLYFAWLDGAQHSAMTGSPAKIEPVVGSKFAARDGYISGKLVTLDLGRRLIMSWRTTDFPRDAHDSRVEIHFEGLGAGTRVTILHTEIPEGQGEKYRVGWMEQYFTPMRAHFSKFLPDPRLPPPPRRPPPPPEEDEEDEEDETPTKGKLAPKVQAKPIVVRTAAVASVGKPTSKAPPPPVKATAKAPETKPVKPAPKAPAPKAPAPKAPAKKPAPKAPAKKPAKKR